MKSIYLCGPITGQTYEDARFGWRKQVLEAFKGTGIVCLSPMRAKDFLGKDDNAGCLSPMGHPTAVLSTPRGITARDRFDTTRADIIFCNLLRADRPSIGSMVEFGWADAHRIPILAVMEPGNVHEHAIVNELIGWRVHTLEEGIAIARAVLVEHV